MDHLVHRRRPKLCRVRCNALREVLERERRRLERSGPVQGWVLEHHARRQRGAGNRSTSDMRLPLNHRNRNSMKARRRKLVQWLLGHPMKWLAGRNGGSRRLGLGTVQGSRLGAEMIWSEQARRRRRADVARALLGSRLRRTVVLAKLEVSVLEVTDLQVLGSCLQLGPGQFYTVGGPGRAVVQHEASVTELADLLPYRSGNGFECVRVLVVDLVLGVAQSNGLLGVSAPLVLVGPLPLVRVVSLVVLLCSVRMVMLHLELRCGDCGNCGKSNCCVVLARLRIRWGFRQSRSYL
mmetsp:Transcript_13085/g.52198  ORF Transcript_13085/g.52198 Transcript_13085/m.52198 type:complete len:294 (+) Transcript_13085:478-1359(+)